MYTHNRYANTSNLEEYLYGIINGVVSDHVFAGTLPSTTDINWNDMVLIDCDLPIDDREITCRATVYIFLYARPNTDGSKNTHRLAEMENLLDDVLDTAFHEHYSINRQSNGGDYDSQINWHRNYVYVNVLIS